MGPLPELPLPPPPPLRSYHGSRRGRSPPRRRERDAQYEGSEDDHSLARSERSRPRDRQPQRGKPIGKCPVFNGNDSVAGFFHIFERWCNSGSYSEDERTTALCTALAGDARDFIQSLPGLERVTYGEMKQALTANFGRRQTEQFQKLYNLRQGTRALEQYVADFRKLRNQAAITHLRDDMQVTLFLAGLSPPSLRNACQTNGPCSLQEAIDVATRLEPVYCYVAERVAATARDTRNPRDNRESRDYGSRSYDRARDDAQRRDTRMDKVDPRGDRNARSAAPAPDRKAAPNQRTSWPGRPRVNQGVIEE